MITVTSEAKAESRTVFTRCAGGRKKKRVENSSDYKLWNYMKMCQKIRNWLPTETKVTESYRKRKQD